MAFNPYETTTDLLALTKEFIGDENSTQTTSDRLTSLMNRAQYMIYAGGGELNYDQYGRKVREPVIFPWAKAKWPLVTSTIAAQDNATVALTNGNDSVSWTSGGTVRAVNDFIKVLDTGNVYRLEDNTNDLDTTALEATGSYEVEWFRLLYSFYIPSGTDFIMPADFINIYESNGNNYKISLVDRNEIDKKYPIAQASQGVPRAAGVYWIEKDDTGTNPGEIMIRLSHYPKDALKMELPYVGYPTYLSLGDPVMPIHYRPILAHMAASWFMVDDDDDRARFHLEKARVMYSAMVDEANYIQGVGGDLKFGSISPWGGNSDEGEAGSDKLGNGFIDFRLGRR